MIDGVPMGKQLTPEILSNPEHKFVQTILYIYTMQSFIFDEMNAASRKKDFEKLKYYGPLAVVLSFIIHCGNKRKIDN